MALKQSLTDNNRPITRPNGQNIHCRGNESENITHPSPEHNNPKLIKWVINTLKEPFQNNLELGW